MLSLSSMFKKASNLLGLGEKLKPPPLDGEIIYCKNNVCVHPPAPLTLDVEHNPGYLNIRAQNDTGNGPTLILTWIPNSSLKKNPRSVEASPAKSRGTSPRSSPRRSRQEFAKSEHSLTTPSPSLSPGESSLISTDSEFYNQSDFSQHKPQKRRSKDTVSLNSISETSDSIYQSEGLIKDGTRLSISNKSQADSGICADDVNLNLLQNNEKSIPRAEKPNKIGVNVNDFTFVKDSNNDLQLKNVQHKIINDNENKYSESDEMTSEEQLAAMLNRNKLHPKAKEVPDPHKAVSIEMQGDQLVVVTEDMNSPLENASMVNPNLNSNERKFDTHSSLEGLSESSESANPSPLENHNHQVLGELCEDFKPNDTVKASTNGHAAFDMESNVRDVPNDLPISYDQTSLSSITTPDISVTRCRMSSSSTTTSGPDSSPPSPYSSPSTSPLREPIFNGNNSITSNESLPCSHNLTFPSNSVTYSSNTKNGKKTAREQICGVFSVDLGQMRSLRLFYNDPECTQGQVVIASRESQYKILHFHHGGLDKLAEIFSEWNLFAKSQEKNKDGESTYKQFLIVRPQVTDDQCHPEEGVFQTVTEDTWKHYMNGEGQVPDDFHLRKAIFFGGLDPALRGDVWPFLLHYYPFYSTFEEREQIRNDKYIEYHNIRKLRESMTENERIEFWKKIQCIVEKDVVRTDRSHPYFKGEDNPNIEVLQEILLSYAVANPWMGYNQGMSDLLAPVLAEVQHEVDAYWCFVGLMQRTIFISSPKDSDMDKQLVHIALDTGVRLEEAGPGGARVFGENYRADTITCQLPKSYPQAMHSTGRVERLRTCALLKTYLRGLICLMQHKFYEHLKSLGHDAMELLFCHRWILLCFKREFPESDALKIWEACWAHYQTDYFHLFICVAIIAIYGDDVIEQKLPEDEILLHFSSLAMHMNGDLVLRKARGLLHKFRRVPKIPCNLHGLCSLCGPGMWDSGHVPIVECIGHPPNDTCPYSSKPNSPVKPNF